MTIFGTNIQSAVSFFSEPVTIKREGAPTVVSGRIISPGVLTETEATASVQPANQRDLMQAPEGTIEPGDSVIHSNTEMRRRDIVEFTATGVEWHVQHVTYRPASGTYRALAKKVDR